MKQLFRFVLFFILMLSINKIYSQQTVILSVPQALEIDAGNDITIDQYVQVMLGGNPTAQFGLPPYQYNWTPVTGLDDPSSQNPIASPEDTITYTLEVIDANGCYMNSVITINVITIGIDDITNNYDISIYPNPNSGIVNIDFYQISGDMHILVMDLNGKLIEEREIYIESGYSCLFDLQQQPAGRYLLQFRGEDFLINHSIIKE